MHASADAPSASSRHWSLVLNGKSAGNDDLREAVHTLRSQGVRLEVRVTWEAGDVKRIVARAIEDGADTIIAAGGDGTVGRVAGCLARMDGDADALPALGIVPLGTANDFATAAGIPIEPLEALQLLVDCPAHRIDLLRVQADDRVAWCVNLASGGFGTRITVETNETLKQQIGGLAYLLTGMTRLAEVGPISAHLQGEAGNGNDFSYDGEFIALGIGNGRQAGGGHLLCPDALIDDGLLDLTIIEPLDGSLGATLGTLLTEGRKAAIDRSARRMTLRNLQLTSDDAIMLNLDGEPLESRHFEVACIPGRVRMHLPRGCALLSRRA